MIDHQILECAMEKSGQYSKRALKSYCKWAAAAVRHSVSLDEILYQTRLYHGDEFAGEVERTIKDFM
jgi:hypothetical protein